jgi:hypothetical protein
MPAPPLPFLPALSKVRHKCFITFHQEDRYWVDLFLRTFDDYRDCFIGRSLGAYVDIVNVHVY